MTRHSVNNNTRMDLVISLCSNSNHFKSSVNTPQTASNFRHLLSCGTVIAFPLPAELSDRKLYFAEKMSLQTLPHQVCNE